jgi:hypothetical protein
MAVVRPSKIAGSTTAAAHAVPIYTQGTDFDDIPGIQVVRI